MEGFAQRLKENVCRVLIGKEHTVELAITTLVAGGHLLIEDRPGVGKTLLARALARSLDVPFQRVQCTADMLPADILGAQVYHPNTGEIVFRPGPVFTNVLLADELNRTPPRTQSALLECMQERHVSMDRQVHDLPDPFFVVATQNPLQFAGTYPLPESQLDRFLMRVNLGYPDAKDEIAIVIAEDGHEQLLNLTPVATVEDLHKAREALQNVRVEEDLVSYIVELAGRTRSSGDVMLGVSSRGTQSLHRACRARAVCQGRDYVVPEDVRVLARPVFAHRMCTRGGEAATEAVLCEIMDNTAMPT
ncbi:MAG: AAA family ATPase [Planctomycetota bacterium]|jgi:MoxR-like ATPase